MVSAPGILKLTLKHPSKKAFQKLLSWEISVEMEEKKVTAVFKKGSKKDYSNYHPISLLSIPSKIVEHLMSAQINQHLIKFNL